jgi:hypothetical protein
VEEDGRFACVFCNIPFKTFYEWRRHEESAHVAPVEFICEDLVMRCSDGKCVYCGAGENWNLDMHRLHAKTEHQRSCSQKARAERTFSRKDHLVQHIRRVHKAALFSIDDNHAEYGPEWSKRGRPLDALDDALFCGFCGYRSEDWAGRVAHVTAHFKLGCDVSNWDWNRMPYPH